MPSHVEALEEEKRLSRSGAGAQTQGATSLEASTSASDAADIAAANAAANAAQRAENVARILNRLPKNHFASRTHAATHAAAHAAAHAVTHSATHAAAPARLRALAMAPPAQPAAQSATSSNLTVDNARRLQRHPQTDVQSSITSRSSGSAGTASAAPTDRFKSILTYKRYLLHAQYSAERPDRLVELNEGPQERTAQFDAIGYPVLKALTPEQRGTVLINQASKSTEGDAHEMLALKRALLSADSGRYFDHVANDPSLLPFRIFPSKVNPDAIRLTPSTFDQRDLMTGLFATGTQGVLFGETHNQDDARRLLIDNMHHLSKLGVRSLYLETGLADVHQSMIDDHLTTGAPIRPALEEFLKKREIDNSRGYREGQFKKRMLSTSKKQLDETEYPNGYRALIDAARRAGIRTVFIDSTASSPPQGTFDFPERLRKMNYFATGVINAGSKDPSAGKYVALMGTAHLNRFLGVPGVAELVNGISVRVERGHITHFGAPTRSDADPDSPILHFRNLSADFNLTLDAPFPTKI